MLYGVPARLEILDVRRQHFVLKSMVLSISILTREHNLEPWILFFTLLPSVSPAASSFTGNPCMVCRQEFHVVRSAVMRSTNRSYEVSHQLYPPLIVWIAERTLAPNLDFCQSAFSWVLQFHVTTVKGWLVTGLVTKCSTTRYLNWRAPVTHLVSTLGSRFWQPWHILYKRWHRHRLSDRLCSQLLARILAVLTEKQGDVKSDGEFQREIWQVNWMGEDRDEPRITWPKQIGC